MTGQKLTVTLRKNTIDDLERVMAEKNTILRNCDDDSAVFQFTRDDIMSLALHAYIKNWGEREA